MSEGQNQQQSGSRQNEFQQDDSHQNESQQSSYRRNESQQSSYRQNESQQGDSQQNESQSVRPPRGGSQPSHTPQGHELIELGRRSEEFKKIKEQMNNSIEKTRNNGFSRYKITHIQRVWNTQLFRRFNNMRKKVAQENNHASSERLLFHGSPHIDLIVQNGFNGRYTSDGSFGTGFYFSRDSVIANKYVQGRTGCRVHTDRSCYICERQLLLCRVALGKSFILEQAKHFSRTPSGHHSIVGVPSRGGLTHKIYLVPNAEQIFPEFLITYKLVK